METKSTTITTLSEFYIIIAEAYAAQNPKYREDIYTTSDRRRKGVNTTANFRYNIVSFNHSVVPVEVLKTMVNKYTNLKVLKTLLDTLYPKLHRTAYIDTILADLA